MRKHICLVIPPSSFLLDDRVFMSLGLLSIAAVLEKDGWEVEVLDLSGVENYIKVVGVYLSTSKVKTIGITATTPQIPAAVRISKKIRQNKKIRVIVGGPHVTLVNSAYKLEKKRGVEGRATHEMECLKASFDVLVAGSGERAIFDALSIGSGVVDADDKTSELFMTDKAVDDLPFPARHLVDVESYNYEIDGVSALSLIGQFGCPFGCSFCGGRLSPTFRNIRTRTPEKVVSEMVHMYHKYGTCGFMFYDDELNVNKKMIELMDLISKAQKKLRVKWMLRGFIKSHLFTEVQAVSMYRAGFRWILVGFESGSPRILENINKIATVEQNTSCVRMAHENGLKVKALMSVGHPGESKRTIEDSSDWLLSVRPDDFDVTIITPYPGTPYYDNAVRGLYRLGMWSYVAKSGDRLHQYCVDYTKTPTYYKGVPDEYESHVFTDFISSDELVMLRDSLEETVKTELNIDFSPGVDMKQYEHSMGQHARLPIFLLKTNKRPRA